MPDKLDVFCPECGKSVLAEFENEEDVDPHDKDAYIECSYCGKEIHIMYEYKLISISRFQVNDMEFDTVIDPMPKEMHFIGLDSDGYWTMTWGKRAGEYSYSLVFDAYIQVMQWCKDFGIKYIFRINFNKIAAAREILLANAYMPSHVVAELYTQTIQQAEHIINNYEIKLWGDFNGSIDN